MFKDISAMELLQGEPYMNFIGLIIQEL